MFPKKCLMLNVDKIQHFDTFKTAPVVHLIVQLLKQDLKICPTVHSAILIIFISHTRLERGSGSDQPYFMAKGGVYAFENDV